MRSRSRWSSPQTQRRLGPVTMLVAALCGGIGATIRASQTPGTSAHSFGYFFDVAGWLLAPVAAVLETRGSLPFVLRGERQVRRRAILLLLGGLLWLLISCWLASTVVDRDSPVLLNALVGAVMVGAVAAGISGFATLAWHYGGAYAARKIEERSGDEW